MSAGKSSGMIGVSTEKAIILTNWMPTIAHSVRAAMRRGRPELGSRLRRWALRPSGCRSV